MTQDLLTANRDLRRRREEVKPLQVAAAILRACKIYSLTLSLPGIPQSLNVALRSHYKARAKDNRAWDNEIAAEVHGKKPARPLSRARLAITRHSHRMLDFDGAVGSLKPVVDALVTAGILADDSWKVLGAWHVDQKFRPERLGPLLEIIVFELPSE